MLISRYFIPKFQSRKKHYGIATRRLALRLISMFVAISLISATTPAAPRAIADVSQQWHAEINFWFKANDILPRLWKLIPQQNLKPKPEEPQSARDQRVTRLQIFPGDVTVQEGQQVHFTAVAYDAQNSPVGGVKFDWTTRDEDRNRNAASMPRGQFIARARGNFKVAVDGAGQTASVKVKVVDGRRNRKDEQPVEVRTASSRDLPPEAMAQLKKDKKAARKDQKESSNSNDAASRKSGAKFAHARTERENASAPAAPAPFYLAYEWGPDNYWSADDPNNTRGNPPAAPTDGGAGSGNFQLSAPILGLPGRGIDIPLALSYNSRLWNKAGTNINYDFDRDWPAPGWSLGFGKIVGMGVYNGGMLIDPDGTRHSYTGTINIYSWGTYFNGHTTDGSFIDYWYYSGTGGALTSAQARLPNGTTIFYYAQGTGGLYPTSILDPNGNYIPGLITRLWDTQTGRLKVTLSGLVVFGPVQQSGLNLLVTLTEKSELKFWNADTGELQKTVTSYKGSFSDSIISPDGRLVVRYGGKKAYLWEAASGRLIAELTPPQKRDYVVSGHHEIRVEGAAFSPDSKLVATKDSLNSIQLWDTDTGRGRALLEGHGSIIYDLTFSRDARLLASASRDGTAKLWEVATGRLRSTLKAGKEIARRVQFNPASTLLAVGYQSQARLWEVSSGQLRATLAQRDDINKTVLFGTYLDAIDIMMSPDGRLLLTIGNKSINVWSTATGTLLTTLEGAHAPVAFSPDGKALAATGRNKDVLVWTISN